MVIVDPRYSFSKAILSDGEMSFDRSGESLEAQRAIVFVALASASDGLPLELVSLNPDSVVAIPASVKGTTQVRYIGDPPLASVETDRFGNLQVALPKNSAMEVIYTINGLRGRKDRKKKIFTTV